MDQGNNRVYLVAYEDGKVLRESRRLKPTKRAELPTMAKRCGWPPPTIGCFCAWMRRRGRRSSEYYTPGAGVIYRMTGDPPARSQSSGEARAGWSATSGGPLARRGVRHGRAWTRVARRQVCGWRLPPRRTCLSDRPGKWIVEQKFATAANRPHGMGWEGKYLWVTDSNLNAFFKHDPATGEIVEKIQLSRYRSVAPRDDHLEGCALVLRRRWRRLPHETIAYRPDSKNLFVTPIWKA